MSAPLVEPSACTWCGIARRGHGGQYADAVGYHAWERPTDAQVKARMQARRLARVVAREGALPVPAGGVPRTLDRVEDELTGVSLSLYEEELETARLRLALASAQRGRRDLRELVRQMCDALNGYDCPPPGETPMQMVTRVSIAWSGAEDRVAELEAERHSTNEALDDAVKALKTDRDRIAELEAAPTFVYRAEHPDSGIVLGTYCNREAAVAHCEALARREGSTGLVSWVPDDGDALSPEELTFFDVEYCDGDDVPVQTCTGYVVTPLEVASGYDEEADE